MTEDRKIPAQEDRPEELTPEQIERIVAGDGGTGGGAGKVNVGDLAFPPYHRPDGPRLTT